MKTTINLLPTLKKDAQWETLRFWFSRIATVSVVLFIFSVLTVFAINFFLIPQRSTLLTQADQARARIGQHRETEALYTVLTKKMDYLTEETNKRFPYAAVFDAFLSVVADRGRITNLAIDRSGSVTMTVTVSSSEGLQELITQLLHQDIVTPYSVTLKGTTRNANGSYDLAFFLKREGK